MNSVELVKNICKERKIPISRLEQDLNRFKYHIKKSSIFNSYLKPA